MSMELPSTPFIELPGATNSPVEDRLYFAEQAWHMYRKADALKEKIAPFDDAMPEAQFMMIGGYAVTSTQGWKYVFDAVRGWRAHHLEKLANDYWKQV